jgi:hypothetical protein
VNKPETGDLKKLQHHLGEIADGKAKFKDDVPFTRLVNYVIHTHEQVSVIHNRPLKQFITVNPHKEDLLGQADMTAENIFYMLLKQNKMTDIVEHHRSTITHNVSKLVKSVLTYGKLTPSLVEKAFAVTKKLEKEGGGYMIRHDISQAVDAALKTYADNSDVIGELEKFHDWLNQTYPKTAWGTR